MNALLEDNNTYISIKKDPTKTLIRNLHDLLSKWKKREYISNKAYKKLNCTDGVLQRAYGVPKIHKTGCIIVSSTNSPLHGLAEFLHDIIHSSLPIAKSHIANSFQLVEKLTKRYIHNNYKLISLDVIIL